MSPSARAAEMREGRLLEHPPAAGAWNMSVDELLLDGLPLDGAGADGPITLRFYRWERPTLSLGYFQRYSERESHAASRGCPLVRRSSGGGAIVHDSELTYSLTVARGHPLAGQTQALYDAMHLGLIDALSDWNVDARLVGASDVAAPKLSPGNEPFLCFERRAPGDVLLGAAKIAGSAQRRRRGAILQHGSVLLSASAAAPELKGLCELASAVIESDALAAAWRPRIEARLGLPFRSVALTDDERDAAAILAREKHASDEWIQRR